MVCLLTLFDTIQWGRLDTTVSGQIPFKQGSIYAKTISYTHRLFSLLRMFECGSVPYHALLYGICSGSGLPYDFFMEPCRVSFRQPLVSADYAFARLGGMQIFNFPHATLLTLYSVYPALCARQTLQPLRMACVFSKSRSPWVNQFVFLLGDGSGLWPLFSRG